MSKLLAMMMREKTGEMPLSIVGNPTITDGVVSGFSSSDYLQTNLGISNTTNIIEISLKFTIGTISEQGIFGSTNNFTKYGFNLNSDGTLRTGVRVSVDGTESNKNLSSDLVLSANSTYYAVMSCDKNTHILTLKISTDGQNWTTKTSDIGSFDNFVGLGNNKIGYTQNGAFDGSIDIKSNKSFTIIDGTKYIFTIGA